MAGTLQERHFTFDNVPESKTIRRYIEKQVNRWIGAHLKEAKSDGYSYSAVFRKEDKRSVICCHLKISAGPRVWRASWYARDIHLAVRQCLGHLTQKSIPQT